MAVGVVITYLILPLLGLGSPSGTKSMSLAMAEPSRFSALIVDTVKQMGWTSLVIFGLLAYPLFCLLVKRRHDRNSNGWDVLVLFALIMAMMLFLALGFALTVEEGSPVPVPSEMLITVAAIYWVGLVYMFVVAGLLKGTDGANKYGPDPVAD